MENGVIFRPLEKGDYKTICKWWTWWWKRVLPKDFLPDNGKSGFMVEKNNIPVACGFLYITNSKVAFLGWVVSNPEYKDKDRRTLIELLINNIEESSRQMDYKYMFTVCSNKYLIETHKNLGWKSTQLPSHELIKKI